MANIFTHNGIFTVTSTATGEHRTFRVRTQPHDSKFAPGKRILGLLIGPDNTFDYDGIGFVDDGKIHVWRKHPVGGRMESYAKMLENMDKLLDNGKIEVVAATKCRRCNRQLTTPESVDAGIGPECIKKMDF